MSYRLYVGQSKIDKSKFCPGSVACMRIIDNNPALEKIVRIEDLNTIIANGSSIPKWLDGTPTLVDVENKKIFYGSLSQGIHNFRWNSIAENGNEVSSGTYYLRIKSDNHVQMQKLLLMK